MSQTHRKGRPTGAKTAARVVAEHQPARCAKCGSTDRTPLKDRRDVPCDAHPKTGEPMTHVIIHRCRCANCGQARFERTYVNRNRPGKSARRA